MEVIERIGGRAGAQYALDRCAAAGLLGGTTAGLFSVAMRQAATRHCPGLLPVTWGGLGKHGMAWQA